MSSETLFKTTVILIGGALILMIGYLGFSLQHEMIRRGAKQALEEQRKEDDEYAKRKIHDLLEHLRPRKNSEKPD